ncbi:hypothetical protein LGK97_03825 [Clostridium sp. CS001]|uniref:DUF6115 domain-containing protein n=1 Tax=Clostridium sp. CS001 TaxID=2880648 RepID=UPI001CF47E41|nr:hypothetical protein [Clostridium sp. CS001]MCB2288892.1 hypothetical protein [Clostridium sp. CS001]
MTGLLIFIGLILIILNVIAIKKQNKSFDGALGNAIGNINDYDIKLGEVRQEFSESIVELQSELMAIREIMESSANNLQSTEKINDDNKDKIIIDNYHNGDDSESTTVNITDTNISTNIDNANEYKVNEIKRLFSEGFSDQEISEILKLGKGEVLLIKDLYIR